MLCTIQQRLYRDRRRLVFSVTAIVLASILSFDYLPDPIQGIQSETIMASLWIACLPLISVHLPKKRFLIEVTALGNLVFVIIGHLAPWANFNLANPNVDWISATVLYGLTLYAVHYLTWGRWSDRFKPTKPMRLRSTTHSKLDIKDLWLGLLPTPGHIERCPDPEVVSIDYADGNRKVVRLVNWMPPNHRSETLVHFEEFNPMSSVKFRMEFRGHKRSVPMHGVTTVKFTDQGTQRKIELILETDTLAPRRIIRGWLDDSVGRMMDGRVRNVARKLKACEDAHSVVCMKTQSRDATSDFLRDYTSETAPNPTSRPDRHPRNRRTDNVVPSGIENRRAS